MLAVREICKSFTGGAADVPVLRGVSFSLDPGGSMAIMGPSGSGKSTLLSILGALEEPTSGDVRLDGIDPFAGGATQRATFRNRRVGFVFQDHHLLAGCTALDNVLVPAIAAGTAARETVARGRRLLERVGLGDRLDHRPGALSGGERQRVAVARALVLAPRLLLADEPTGQLDSGAADEVADLLLELTEESGGMLVVVTHSTPLAARVGDVRHLVDGRLAS
ncbi:MAG: ABC transporter ATP-binding protein [Planctomycetes bacterium]|nr:ABC transporter ATP-binding protein [Planctomycetota bacterium]